MIVRASAMILEDFAVEKPVACSAAHIEHALKISPTVQERRRARRDHDVSLAGSTRSSTNRDHAHDRLLRLLLLHKVRTASGEE
jgi:hypothetical protein